MSSEVRFPLTEATATTKTSLWNDSADPDELRKSIEFGAVGATCNPIIALAAISAHADRWLPRIRELAAEHPTATESWIGWKIVEELSVDAASLLLPAFRESGGRDGRLSVQTDPRLHRDAAALVDQAVRFSKLAENIIVKIPATSTGLVAIEEATYRGVSVNATVSFTVPQAVAVGEVIERGLDRREREGLPTGEFGSVVTIMGGRLDDWLKEWTKREHILVDPGILEWAGVAAMKKAYQVFQERGFRSRILSAAFRNYLQWYELLGGDLVVSPPFAWQEEINRNSFVIEDRINVPVPDHILSELTAKVPEFVRAYEVDGMTPAEFDAFGATRKTLRQFLQADADLDALVRSVIVPAP